MASRSHVGTLGEKPLHAALKSWYAEDGDLIEEPVDGFVIDIVRGAALIEIQTRSFSSMKRKLAALLDQHVVHIVYPIAVEKWILKVSDDGEIASRRKSPKQGAAVDLFAELVSFPDLISHSGLSIEVALIREEEVRRFEAGKAWRRNGWVTEERRLLDVVGSAIFDSPAALSSLLPDSLPFTFTTADLADSLGRHRRLAQQMTYCLRLVGAIEMVTKDGNAIVYRRA